MAKGGTSDDLFLSSALLEGSVMKRSVILEGLECFGEVLKVKKLSVSSVEAKLLSIPWTPIFSV